MYNKAIVAFITPLILTLLIPLGVTGESTVTEVIASIVLSLSTAITVYFAKNKV